MPKRPANNDYESLIFLVTAVKGSRIYGDDII